MFQQLRKRRLLFIYLWSRLLNLPERSNHLSTWEVENSIGLLLNKIINQKHIYCFKVIPNLNLNIEANTKSLKEEGLTKQRKKERWEKPSKGLGHHKRKFLLPEEHWNAPNKEKRATIFPFLFQTMNDKTQSGGLAEPKRQPPKVFSS